MKTLKKKFIIFILFTLSLISCNTDYYSDNKGFDDLWNKNNPAKFTFKVDNSKVSYNIYFIIRNDNSYKYSNLWLINKIEYNKKQILIDTLQYQLADKKTGKWLGAGIFNNQLKAIYKENFKFPKTGIYTFEIKHAMRDNKLQGIEDFGIIIENN